MKSRILHLQEEIDRVIKKCDACYMGMVDTSGNPYVIPMNFGYKSGEIFLHSAQTGKKIDILQKNNQVCVAFSTDHELRWQSEKVACSYGMKYRSVVAFGKVVFIEDYDQKVDALNVIMSQYTDREFSYNAPAVKDVNVFKVVVEKFEGKAYGY
ncbi:MAG: pyridoxamine 5'-phosphate oxidase family protein [Bacteroidales bacterium]|nr:pyridoxamine 5'-phosphate oxidase family protein [Bacteroidales bacterium]